MSVRFSPAFLVLGAMAGSPCPVEVMKQVRTKLHMPQVTVCRAWPSFTPSPKEGKSRNLWRNIDCLSFPLRLIDVPHTRLSQSGRTVMLFFFFSSKHNQCLVYTLDWNLLPISCSKPVASTALPRPTSCVHFLLGTASVAVFSDLDCTRLHSEWFTAWTLFIEVYQT